VVCQHVLDTPFLRRFLFQIIQVLHHQIPTV
jgi:hypothetical protein